MRFTAAVVTAVLANALSARAQEDCAAADTTIHFKTITHRGLKSDGSMYYQGYGEGPNKFTPGTFPDFPATCGTSPDTLSTPTLPGTEPAPTAAPVIPTAAPTLDVCSYAYAYCPGLSKSFQELGMSIESENWGWNIDVSSMEPTDSITCPVFLDAVGSNPDAGTQVGEVTIKGGAVAWTYDNDKGAMAFSMYAGKCPVSDAGMHLADGSCDEADEVQWFRTPKQYGLHAEFDETYMTKFYFDSSNEDNYKLPTSLWAENSYKTFPIGGAEGHQFLVLQATVCPCGSLGKECSAMTSGKTPAPTFPVPTATPKTPTTAHPTKAPVSESPTATDATLSSSGCVDSFVYCEGISYCDSDLDSSASKSWYIDLSQADDDSFLECDIIAGHTGCDISTGQKIGSVEIEPEAVNWIFQLNTGGDDFHMYAGSCVGNNNGVFDGDDLNCDTLDVATVTNYPLVAGHYDDKRVNQWQFNYDNADSYISDTWSSAVNDGIYTPFPLGLKDTTGNKFLSLQATACECRLTDGCIPVRR